MLARWHNPIPMRCQELVTHGPGGVGLGQHAQPCATDAVWITVEGETVAGFHCDAHRPGVVRQRPWQSRRRREA